MASLDSAELLSALVAIDSRNPALGAGPGEAAAAAFSEFSFS